MLRALSLRRRERPTLKRPNFEISKVREWSLAEVCRVEALTFVPGTGYMTQILKQMSFCGGDHA